MLYGGAVVETVRFRKIDKLKDKIQVFIIFTVTLRLQYQVSELQFIAFFVLLQIGFKVYTWHALEKIYISFNMKILTLTIGKFAVEYG